MTAAHAGTAVPTAAHDAYMLPIARPWIVAFDLAMSPLVAAGLRWLWSGLDGWVSHSTKSPSVRVELHAWNR